METRDKTWAINYLPPSRFLSPVRTKYSPSTHKSWAGTHNRLCRTFLFVLCRHNRLWAADIRTSRILNRLHLKRMQAMFWGATDLPQIATGYGKMLPENDITEPVTCITSRNRRKMNHITGSVRTFRAPNPLTTTGFESLKKNAPSWHSIVNENMIY